MATSDIAAPSVTTEVPLSALAGRLGDILETTEAAFLALGGRLSDFLRLSRQVAHQAETAAGVLLGETSAQTVDSLRLLVDRLQEHRQEMERRFVDQGRTLEEIGRLLEKMQEPLGGFRKIVKTLQSLGIATRIESSRSDRQQDDTFALADELKELAELIGAHSGRILERLEALGGDCRWAGEKLLQMQAGQSHHSAQLLPRAEAALSLLMQRTRGAIGEAGRFSALAAGFTEEIAEVVASIQFHDIVRQKIEHIQCALTDLARADTAAVGEVCLLQAAHLQLAREEMEGAGRRIVASLNSLAERTAGLALQTAQAAGLEQEGEMSVFREMEEVIADITGLLRSGAMAGEESAAAIEAVAGAVDAMAQLLEEIDFLSEKMKVVALNAAIRAVHAGQEGAGLGVIAVSIQQLARQALEQTRTLAGGFRLIMGVADRLRQEKRENPELLTVDAGRLLERLQGIDRQLLAHLRQMNATSAGLGEELRQTAESLTVHHDFSVQAAEVLTQLKQGAKRLGAAGPNEQETFFRDLLDRYTMHSEREIHQAQRPGAGNSKIIDLQERRAARRGSELGDNVELF